MNKTRVFLTGATGVMGMAGLLELLKYPEEYSVCVLARPSKKNIKKLRPFEEKGVTVIWGDLLNADDISKGVDNADIVLHVGGLVSPEADFFPKKTIEVNVGSIEIIAKQVREIEKKNPEREIKVVYIGSVSQYGSHLPPDHWKEVGDPLSAAKYDAYALSKIRAERIIALSGVRKWVSLRQTAILHPGLFLKADNPVMFHVPLKGAIEWVSVGDSGRLLERVCRKEVPESFWNNFYNVGGGESYRLTNYEFEQKLLKATGCPSPEKIFEPNWFATGNFHGVWFKDSDLLDDILHFRSGETFDEVILKFKNELPPYFRLTPLAPAFIIKAFMKKVAQKEPLGTLYWIKNNDLNHITAAWGSMENYKKIPSWGQLKFPELPRTFSKISDKETGISNDPIIKIKTGQQNKNSGTLFKDCRHNHSYLTSEFLETRGGHSCPICLNETTGLKL